MENETMTAEKVGRSYNGLSPMQLVEMGALVGVGTLAAYAAGYVSLHIANVAHNGLRRAASWAEKKAKEEPEVSKAEAPVPPA